MSNLIRIKQIDQEGLYQIFTQFLSTEYATGILSDLISANAIFKTGDQSISGAKNFVIRPTVNYTGVLISGDGGKNISFNYGGYGYKNIEDPVKDLLDRTLYVQPNMILTNTSGTVEKGITGKSITLNWALTTGYITGQSLTNTGSMNISVRNVTFTGLNLTSDTTYILSYGDEKTNKSTTTTFSFKHKRYWGANILTSLSNSDILSLENKEFATSRLQERFFSPGGGYIYFAYPSGFGNALFRVNGLNNSAWISTGVNFTNASNYTEPYLVYRSQYVQYGTNIRVEVL